MDISVGSENYTGGGLLCKMVLETIAIELLGNDKIKQNTEMHITSYYYYPNSVRGGG